MMSEIICAHGNAAYKEKIVVSFGKGSYKSLVVCLFLFKYQKPVPNCKFLHSVMGKINCFFKNDLDQHHNSNYGKHGVHCYPYSTTCIYYFHIQFKYMQCQFMFESLVQLTQLHVLKCIFVIHLALRSQILCNAAYANHSCIFKQLKILAKRCFLRYISGHHMQVTSR